MIDWFERAAKVGAIPKLILRWKKLASVFQFVRAMPEEFVCGEIASSAVTNRASKKRKRIV